MLVHDTRSNDSWFNNAHFFKMGFTPCKVEQPLQSMELQVKETKEDESIQEISLERTYS